MNLNLNFDAVNSLGKTEEKGPAIPEQNKSQEFPAQTGSLQRRAELTQKVLEQSREINTIYQQRVRRTEILKTDIIKGVQRGEDIETLFLQAVEIVGMLTDDTVILEQVRCDLEKKHEAEHKISPLV